MAFNDIFWMIFAVLGFLSLIFPGIKKALLQKARVGKLHELEKERGTRVIALIHRQETFAFLGIPVLRYIDIEDSEKILRAIRKTDPETPIELIIHTPGGLMLAAEQIAFALCAHPSKVTVIVPHYAMSGGALLALAADQILMDKNSVIGPVDPQVKENPAASILAAVSEKDANELDDETLILADISRKARRQVRDTIIRIVQDRMSEEEAEKLAEKLSSGQWTHDYPIRVEEAQALGLPVDTNVPGGVFDLMEMYAQTSQRRPSVQYVPVSKDGNDSGGASPPSKNSGS